MIFRYLSIHNFKTLKLDRFRFEDYNVIIGANAAGKSNLISFFEFFDDFLNKDIESAISLQGGLKNVLNIQSEKKDLWFELILESKVRLLDDLSESKPTRVRYKYSVNFEKSKPKSVNEELLLEYVSLDETLSEDDEVNFLEYIQALFNQPLSYPENGTRSDGLAYNKHSYIKIVRNNEILQIDKKYGEFSQKQMQDFESFIALLKSLFERKVHLKSYSIISDYHKTILDKITIIRSYDINTKTSKHAVSYNSENYLMEDGSNLIQRLYKLFQEPDRKKRFLQLYTSFLPYISNIKVRESSGNALSLFLKEQYYEVETNSSLISDGTIGLLGLILGLYFEETNVILLEEPEKFLHPEIIRKIANAIEDVSLYKQILITTHNPELLKHLNMDHVIFIKRDNDGYSSLTYPTGNDRVKEFLKNDLGLDDLFVDNLIGVN